MAGDNPVDATLIPGEAFHINNFKLHVPVATLSINNKNIWNPWSKDSKEQFFRINTDL